MPHRTDDGPVERFTYIAVLEHIAPGVSRPLTVTSDPQTVRGVIRLIERRLRLPEAEADE
jgi:hypothetical protein